MNVMVNRLYFSNDRDDQDSMETVETISFFFETTTPHKKVKNYLKCILKCISRLIRVDNTKNTVGINMPPCLTPLSNIIA